MFLQERHAGDVREGLRDKAVGFVQLAGIGAEQLQRAQDDAGGAHRDGMNGGEPGVERGRDEAGPLRDGGVQIGDRDRLTGGVTIDTRALVGLQLEKLQFAGRLGGGRQQPQLLERVGEQEPGGGDVEQLCAVSVSSVIRSTTSKSSSRMSTRETTASNTRVSRGVSVTLPSNQLVQ